MFLPIFFKETKDVIFLYSYVRKVNYKYYNRYYKIIILEIYASYNPNEL